MTQRALLLVGLLSFVTAVPASPAATVEGKPLLELAAEVGEGEIRLSFDAREGVRGCGDSIFSENDGDSRTWWGRHDHEGECEKGPVRVRLKVRDGNIVKIKTRVGRFDSGNGDRTLDLGLLPAQEAAARLLALARQLPDRIAADAVWPLQLGRDVTIWPELLSVARDRALGQELRQAAMFWLSQIAGDKITAGLREIVADSAEEIEVRETAMFALSERNDENSLPLLVEIARTNRHPQLRRSALFWLAQRDDPRVVDVFEEILIDR